ncbi:MAG: GNAT family N-acetyltransferase [Ilumatobacter sp.]|uniref:GNAT family N-acetyltransferase n=1 Tax=Ilumatobacter sp. TaxID=1967498 RepID=UPI00391DE3AD
MPAFETITTERLVIRPTTFADAEALWERRNDPEAARYQNWTLPFPRERADAMCRAAESVDGPENDTWWMAAVCDRATGDVIGDLALQLTFDERSAEIGYTFARRVWGRGSATEAADALVGWLFDSVGVSRVHAQTHPENLASVVVLERIGLRFEGHTRNSYWVGDEMSDDWIFGMTAHDRSVWTSRPRTPPARVELVEITSQISREVERLETHKSQERLVAPMSGSFADALFPGQHHGAQVVPWLRAVVADDAVVGFVMVARTDDTHHAPYLWRLLIDRLHQRRGIGSRVLDLVAEQARAWGADRVEVSWVPGPGSPAPLYLRHGFVPTGEVEDGEVVASLAV